MARLGVRGGLSVDHLVWEGQGARFRQLGGPGLFAVLGARLVSGVEVRLAANLPADEPRFAELCDQLGVDRRYCVDVPAATRLWILNSFEGRRIVGTAAPTPVELEMPGESKLAESEPPADPRFCSGLDALLESAPIRRPQVDAGLRVGIDPHQVPMRTEGIGYLRRVTPPAGIVLPSRVQLALIDSDVREAARRVSIELDTPVVARLDQDGIFVVDAAAAHEWAVLDSEVKVEETTGAGDSSAAAIMAALALGADIVSAAMFGIAIARFALAGWGADVLLKAEPISTPPNGITAIQEK
ncbi:MAG: PfkB family carbohydrate kinase [Propionibacteriaceae bacterium]|jgi:sugar/nucleoside kinase (ribokinase family)|nr:PfkB family carbohydrate kinase [Propionibacteriaceae bacterium]